MIRFLRHLESLGILAFPEIKLKLLMCTIAEVSFVCANKAVMLRAEEFWNMGDMAIAD